MATHKMLLKTAFEFRLSGVNETQIRNYIVDNIWDPFWQKVLDAAGDATGISNVSSERGLRVFKHGDVWEVYPKVIVAFDTTRDMTASNTFVDDAIDRAFSFFKRRIEADQPTIQWVRKTKFKSTGKVRE